jgi:ferrous iron transport protein A
MKFTLDKLEKGLKGKISGFDMCAMQISRLLCLGLTIGSEIEVTQNYGKGPIMISVRSTCLALGRGVAQKIWIETTPNKAL